ncbi:hypothetical protein A2803_03110 [Candidatus Woesebacteria bacterium RIFCSPHIGHO2_01_FULL_44_21]|uniref:HEPN domain-containing protein n=1 Tax=Candidatus Woesebacteria bacterium RIFCSPHIGHO2_01_FULL_44_21 TaxID=1802503 RepID=A0A1F7Z0F3_9BACT|nr:MAG: hypothetical protein A2803_03110 [Candidatus Woesebacteria bacterium RIFCSPHIGHO2_01_FULL_44_21]OGM69173.1 MAG: hypothetical protein A2897_05135 [Candidatus Woesebacteria bacterium RIFCSPLOWO2_01_FULL_44_24b]
MKITNKPWWSYLSEDLQESIELSFQLADMSSKWSSRFHDYSFIVFPAAKAYEGFLKKLFLDMGFITKADYFGRHFRIGKALNPDLEEKYRDSEWVYEKLTDYCKGEALPDKLWKTWKESRNLVFHWFPDEKNTVDHAEAVEKLLMVVAAIDEVFTACRVKLTLST